MKELICFTLGDARYAVPADRVIEVVARVLVTPLPEAPAPVLGIFSYRGTPMAVVDLRARLGHPSRSPLRDDHFLLVQSARRPVALAVDRVTSAEALPQAGMQAPPLPSRHIAGVVPLQDGLMLIEDLDAVLSLDEEAAIDAGAARLGGAG